MKVLIGCLVYGNRPLDIIHSNLEKAGYPFEVMFINKEGIANALNEAIYKYEQYDAIGYLANDIEEPEGWLQKKVNALLTYPEAGVVASSFSPVRLIESDFIISNYLISKKVIEKVGMFNFEYYPYGAIDLEYLQRCWVAEFKTYYVQDCIAKHIGSHATGDEYGYNKEEMVKKYWDKYTHESNLYRNKQKDIWIWQNKQIAEN